MSILIFSFFAEISDTPFRERSLRLKGGLNHRNKGRTCGMNQKTTSSVYKGKERIK